MAQYDHIYASNVQFEMNEIKLKYKPRIGFTINDELIRWNTTMKEVSDLALFKKLALKPSDSIVKSRFNNGVKFLDFHKVEIENTVAFGFNYRFGLNSDNQLIEFCSPWNFKLECYNIEINYCSNYSKLESILKGLNIEFRQIELGSAKIKEWNLVYSKSEKPEARWNQGNLIEYLYIYS